MYDTCIIGAGPIGSHIARKLSILGHRVLVLEKKAAADRDVCCTGIVGKECLGLLETTGEIVLRKANCATLFSPKQRSVTLQREGDIAYILDRPLLNTKLYERAQASGADYKFSCFVTKIESSQEGVKIFASSIGNCVFEAKSVVIACGYGSNLPVKLGLGGITRFTVGIQAEVETNNCRSVELYLDQTRTPGSFSWLVPTRENRALAGMMTNSSPHTRLCDLLSLLREKGKISGTYGQCTCQAIPLGRPTAICGDRVLVVGEAAGHIKPITGGGLYFGLLGADIAINVLHDALLAGDLSGDRLSDYQYRCSRLLGTEIKIGRWLRDFWFRLGNTHLEYLFDIIACKRARSFIENSDSFSFDWHGRMLLNSLKLFSPVPW